MTSPTLLIVSIFAPSRRNSLWRHLQERFLTECTAGLFDYRLYLNGVAEDEFEGAAIAHVSPANEGHAAALANVLNICRTCDHDWFLLLDSDCFPVTAGWNEILCRQMADFKREMAAPVRTENLDLFPHPCAVMMSRAALFDTRLNFDLASEAHNLLGDPIRDVGAAMALSRPPLLPLLRTNRINLHPVGAAIYHHLFYHHGAGSRVFRFRVTDDYRFHEHWLTDHPSQDELIAALTADPRGFIDLLKNGVAPTLLRASGEDS